MNEQVALRKESVDRNSKTIPRGGHINWSLSARRAWIEMEEQTEQESTTDVALRKESVDRNLLPRLYSILYCVALRKESVDRNNPLKAFIILTKQVALRKESVDRNASLFCGCSGRCVALRKESVDRNMYRLNCHLTDERRSPQGERG